MADNTELASGSGGDTLRTEDRAGVKTPVSLIDVGGASGSEALLGDAGVALPVRGLAAADAALSGNPVPIAGRGSAAAPSAMSADNDATIPWLLLNGSMVVNVAVGGTLVTGSAGLPVAQQGTWTVALSSTDNTVLDDIAASVAGTLTVDNGGTFAVQVDGSALTALQLIDDVVYADDADWTDGTSKHALVGGLYQSTPQTITDGDVGPFQVTSNGFLIVSVNGTVTVATHAVTQSGAWTTSGTGTAGSAATGVMTVQGIASMTPVQVSQATASNLNATVVGTGTFAVQATCNAGTNLNTSALALESGGNLAGAATSLAIIDDWDESDRCKVNPISGQAGVAGGAGAVGATVQRVVQAGSTPFKNIDVDESQDSIKGSAGTLRAFVAVNTTNALLYLKFYNIASGSVTVGTSVPVLTFAIPGNNDTDGAGLVWNTPILFDTAITIAATTGVADADTGAPGANALVVSGCYD